MSLPLPHRPLGSPPSLGGAGAGAGAFGSHEPLFCDVSDADLLDAGDPAGDLTWFSAGVRVGMGVGLGVCLGIGLGVGILVSTVSAGRRRMTQLKDGAAGLLK